MVVLLLAPSVRAGTADLRLVHTKLFRVALPADSIVVQLAGAAVVPPSGSSAGGTGVFFFNMSNNTLTFDITHDVVGETSAHIHGPGAPGTNGPIVCTLPAGAHKTGTWNFSEADQASIREELMYVDIHSVAAPGGDLRGQITTCVPKAAIVGHPACCEVVVQNLGPDPYDGVGPGAFKSLLAPGRLGISVDIDEPTKPGIEPILQAYSVYDSFAVDIAPMDSVTLDFGPMSYYPQRAGLHRTTSTAHSTGSNTDPNPTNDRATDYLIVIEGMPAAGILGLFGAAILLGATASRSLRRRRAGGLRS
jgi:hypothetical protein